jgi:hypothetical protein
MYAQPGTWLASIILKNLLAATAYYPHHERSRCRLGSDEIRWGLPTAPIDWCEANYAWTNDVAELHNTWTNLAYVAVGLACLARCRRDGLPVVFWACGASIVLTGIFSACFHATLWLVFQRLDEVRRQGGLGDSMKCPAVNQAESPQ